MTIEQYLDEHCPWTDTTVTIRHPNGVKHFAGVYLWEHLTHRKANLLEITDFTGRGKMPEEIISDFEAVTIDTVFLRKGD